MEIHAYMHAAASDEVKKKKDRARRWSLIGPKPATTNHSLTCVVAKRSIRAKNKRREFKNTFQVLFIILAYRICLSIYV